jgi:hypothetical protein
VLGRVLGKDIAYQQLGREQMNLFFRSFMEWLEENDGYGVNPPSDVIEKWGLPLVTLEEWLRSEGWGTD